MSNIKDPMAVVVEEEEEVAGHQELLWQRREVWKAIIMSTHN